MTVRGGPYSVQTDANGRYEFKSQYPSVPANLYPPSGYERKPVRPTESFPLVPGQNLSVRRITAVTISPPATLPLNAKYPVPTQVSFDTGAVESPAADFFDFTSSDPSTVRTRSGNGEQISVEGLKLGTASVTGTYFGVSSSGRQVQVVP